MDTRTKDLLSQKEILVKMNYREKVKVRHDYNDKILSALKKYIDKHRDVRLIQALQNLGIVDSNGIDRFYEESYDTYQLMLDKILEEVL